MEYIRMIRLLRRININQNNDTFLNNLKKEGFLKVL